MKIRKANKKDMKESITIAKDLEEWFTKMAIKHMVIDFKINNAIVAIQQGKVVGFLCYSAEGGALKINWMAVKREFRRQGIGNSLLKYLIKKARKIKSKAVIAETLSDKERYKPYQETREFYYKNGFKKTAYLKAFKKGWDDQIVMEKRL